MSYTTRKLENVCLVEWGNTNLTKSSYAPDGKYLGVSAAGCDGRMDHAEHSVGTPVLSAIGARCGTMFFPTEDFTAIKNTITFTVDNNVLNNKYLYYFLLTIQIPRRGGAQPFMTQTDVRNIEIPLPPLAEQKKIVAKIERAFAKIDEAIRLREEALEATANLLSATLHEIFEEGKKSYSLEELGRVAKLVRGPFGGSLKKEIFVRDGDCVYEQGNVINNDLVNFRYYIKPTKFEEMKRFAVASGDVLMSCSGTIGKLVIIPSEYKQGIINQALLKMTPNARVNAQYLVYALKDYLSLNNTHVKGMAIKNIAAVKELKVLKIPLPPFGTQKKIVARLDALSAKVRTLQEAQSTQLADLKALKQSILHEAFNPTE